MLMLISISLVKKISDMGLRENVKGNELAKSPEFTADVNFTYETSLSSGTLVTSIFQFIHRGDFQQRVSNNPAVDAIDSYDLIISL